MSEWIEDRVSIDDERKLFVVEDSGDIIAKGLTLREAIAVARERKESLECGFLVTIAVDEDFSGIIDTDGLIFASEKNLRAIEEQGFVDVERRV